MHEPSSETQWQTAPCALVLPAGEIHVWRASLALTQAEIERTCNLLHREELDRANRYHFAKDRNAFIGRRGILRVLLGRYLTGGPYTEPFETNAYGKPSIRSAAACDSIHFNVSHSSGVALLAFARDREIGVDIEAIRSEVDYSSVASRFFSERERTALLALHSESRRDAFFACWSRKEAYVKARGLGLSLPLDSFDVSLEPGVPAQLLALRDDPAEAAKWSVVDLHAGDGYAAALAFEGKGCVVRRYE